MTRSTIVFPCSLLVAACGGGGTSGTGPSVLPPEPEPFVVTNLGLATGEDFALGERYLAFGVDEAEQGLDVNGDGGQHGHILHVYDIENGELINTSIHTALGIELVADRWVFFTKPNLHLQVYDIENRRLRDLALPTLTGYGVGEFIAFNVIEPRLERDLNGDGDAFDRVWHIYEPASDRITNLEIATVRPPFVGASWVGFRVEEVAQGDDLNGDSDHGDWIAQSIHPATGHLASSKLHSQRLFEIQGPITVFDTTEEENGLDLNGDGDLFDFGMVVFDAEAESSVFHVDAKPMGLFGELALFRVFEGGDTVADLNADGDVRDWVVHTLDLGTGVSVNQRIAVDDTRARAVLDTGRALFLADEIEQGHDLDGDGETRNSMVLLVLDTRTGFIRPIPLSGYQVSPRLDFNATFVGEYVLFEGDRSSGGLDDEVLLYDLERNELHGTGFSNRGFLRPLSSEASRAALEVREGDSDLNGNGRIGDPVIVIFDAASGAFHSTQVAGDSGFSGGLRLSGGRTAALVRESSVDRDLNGDNAISPSTWTLHLIEPREPSVP